MGDYNWACFASHRLAEKALKALILHVAGEYLRGHDLV
jgi:HEPN domain-containing protein